VSCVTSGNCEAVGEYYVNGGGGSPDTLTEAT
jgi:hypothetical protein